MDVRIRQRVGALVDAALDLVYPQDLYCVCCGKMIDETRPYRLCNECMSGVKWAVGRTCAKCGKPLSELNSGTLCYGCREHEHVFDRGYTCAEYDSYTRAIVFELKFAENLSIIKTIGEVLHDRLKMLRSCGEDCYYDCIIPVPMHDAKRLRRGFDQAELIAQELARLEGIPCITRRIYRARETSAMKGLTPAERRMNISGAFAAADDLDLSGKSLICVDDLFTTGASADELSRVLYGVGAVRVDYISFAAGADMVKNI